MGNWDKTRVQVNLAIASFSCGVAIGCICLFFIEPIGEIHTSAVGIVSELLVLCGAMLGIKTSFDAKMRKFENDINQKIENK